MSANPSPAETITQITSRLYEGVLDQSAWHEGLDRMRILATAASSALMLFDKASGAIQVMEFQPADNSLRTEYQTHYQHIDPARDYIDNVPLCNWYVDTREFGARSMARDPMYQELLRPHGLVSYRCTPLLREGSVYPAILSMHYDSTGTKRDRALQGALDPLLPHLRNACLLRLKLTALEAQARLGQLALDMLDQPLMLISQSGQVRLTNTAGSQMLMQADSPFRGQGLKSDRPDARALRQALELACGPNGIAGAAHLSLGRPAQSVPATVLPVPPHLAASVSTAEPVALVLIHLPREGSASLASVLHALFGVTPAEARMVESLLSGHVIKQSAAALGISVETARSHVQSLFRKMRVRRQAELIRLVEQLSRGLTASQQVETQRR